MTTTSEGPVIGEAIYKGKKYALLYIGQTQYGRRAKLAFKDLSKEFWVDVPKLTHVEHFPQSVDCRDYSEPRDNAPTTGEAPPDDLHDPEANCGYCASCGQLLPN